MRTEIPANSIKGIFFDAGDTLFKPREAIGKTYCRFAKKHGVNCETEFLNKRFKAVFKHSPSLAFPKASDLERPRLEYQWWYQVVQSVFEDFSFTDFDLFFKELYRYFESKTSWVLFSETKEVLSRLKGEGYYLGMISNFDSRLPVICKHLGISEYFGRITYSSQEGLAKPAPGIFEKALQEASLVPNESIHVGDKLEADVGGAEKVGMIPILLDRSKSFSGDVQIKVISDLQEIDRFL